MSTSATPDGPAVQGQFVDAEYAGRLVAWTAGVATGRASIEAAAEAVEAGTSGHVVSGLPAPEGDCASSQAELPMHEALEWVRGAGVHRVMLVLPTAGSPLGLTGAGALTQAAVLAEVAVVADTASGSFGWVPEHDPRGSSYAGVRWRVYPGSAKVPEPTIEVDRILDQADRALRRALRAATDALTGVDLALWRPEVATGRVAADAALRLRVRQLPVEWPAAARVLGERSLTLWRVLRVAASDQGAISASGSLARTEALRALSQAVRETAMTAFNVPAAAMVTARSPRVRRDR